MGIVLSLGLNVVAQTDSSASILLREIHQDLTTLMREVRIMREACFMP